MEVEKILNAFEFIIYRSGVSRLDSLKEVIRSK